MSVERKQRLFRLLDEALERPPLERQAFLDEACADDDPLRREIEALLETEAEVGLLAVPAFSIHADDSGVGRHIGPYRLVRLLDRGGMGSVYLAEREDFEQQVALKLIRRGLDADEMLVRRFENERQILARLKHPHIAKLLDGGTTEDRLPYFVMEFVEGEPIDRYCRNHELSVAERLVLFRRVCSAVQFAHQNLVIHRDLKPSNIFITEDGHPRLLDFGIAKLLDDSLQASAVETVLGQGPMTPRYASPEQIRLKPVTTTSDVYSLGVLLYELLTGLDPYGVEGGRSDEIARAVCEREPDKPSTAVRRRAREPEAADSRRLRRQLSGDLDSIVLKAMRKEPHLRYASAEQLSEDIRRHLVGLPVGAQTGTFTYRAGKFVRRHRLAMVVVAAFLVLSTSFGIVTFVYWQRAETVSLFLKELFVVADPDFGGAEDEVTGLLGTAQQLLTDGSLDREPELRMVIAGTLGRVLRKLANYAESKNMMEISLAAAREIGDPAEVARRLNNLAVSFLEDEDYAQAEAHFREVLEMRSVLEQDVSKRYRAQSNLATALLRQDELEEAERLCVEVLEAREARYKDTPYDKDVATSRYKLAAVYHAQGRFEEAEPLLSDALTTRRRRFDPKDTRVATVLNLLGKVLEAQGRMEEARENLEEALAIREERLGEQHVKTIETGRNLESLAARTDQTEGGE